MRTFESLPIDHGMADVFEGVIRLAENKDALVLELIEMSALGRCHHFDEGRSIQLGSSCCNDVHIELP